MASSKVDQRLITGNKKRNARIDESLFGLFMAFMRKTAHGRKQLVKKYTHPYTKTGASREKQRQPTNFKIVYKDKRLQFLELTCKLSREFDRRVSSEFGEKYFITIFFI